MIAHQDSRRIYSPVYSVDGCFVSQRTVMRTLRGSETDEAAETKIVK